MVKTSEIPSVKDLFKAGAHYGHRKDKCDARAKDYIYMFKDKIAVINLAMTQRSLQEALDYLSCRAKEGASFMLVGTKTQAKEKIRKVASELKQFHVTDRWPGGLLTNFAEVKKSIKKIDRFKEMLESEKGSYLTKKEKLKMQKELDKMMRTFGGLIGLDGNPDVIIIVDPDTEKIALKEAMSADIPVVALTDVNFNPQKISYPVVANDDSVATVEMFLDLIKNAIARNLRPKKIEEDGAKPESPKKTNKEKDE